MPVKNQSILYSFFFCLTLLLLYSILGKIVSNILLLLTDMHNVGQNNVELACLNVMLECNN